VELKRSGYLLNGIWCSRDNFIPLLELIRVDALISLVLSDSKGYTCKRNDPRSMVLC
jgi:hypothetical protein